MKQHLLRLGIISGALVLLVLAGTPVLAMDSRGGEPTQSPSTSPTPTETEVETPKDTPSANTEGTSNENEHPTQTSTESHGKESSLKLTGPKLELCGNRKTHITDVMERISDRAQKQLVLFGNTATRVETFYTNSGKTLSNYTSLVNDINTKAAAAQAAFTTLKNAGSNFSCTASDPQGAITTFKADLQNEIAAMQAYRTSVKNLIVAVKTLVGDTTEGNNR